MRISDWSSDVCSSDLVGASPGEDELVIVAQEENIVLALRKEAQKTILTLIGVLIFVDHDGVELTCPCPGHLRITLERQKWLQNEVVDVHAIVFAQDRQSVVSGQSVSVRVDHGGRRIIKKNTEETKTPPTNS